MTKKIFAFAFAFAVIGGILAGCSQPAAEGEKAPEATKAPEKPEGE